jgi:hypothetical protein
MKTHTSPSVFPRYENLRTFLFLIFFVGPENTLNSFL